MTATRIERLDVPLPVVEAQAARFTELKAAALFNGLCAEARHITDPADTRFAQLACQHPEACSTAKDYPGWTPGGIA